MSDLSPTMRDYLAEIYRLGDHHKDAQHFVSTSALAELLDVSAPAVNRMGTKLKELRRRRIAEVFLVKVMGFGWHEVFDEAHRISSSLSEILTERMSQMAGSPTHCPHGEPIPSAEGVLPPSDDFLLADAEQGHEFEITRVRTRESDRLEYIAALGLLPGTTLHLLHAAPFKGPLQLKIGREYRIIGHNLAEIISVRPLKTD